MAVCVCTLVSGGARYFLAARQALASVLDRTPFDVVAVVGPGMRGVLPAHGRLTVKALSRAPSGSRVAPFLAKFLALETCLDTTGADYLLLLDADAVVVEGLDEALVEGALDGYPLGMVEQTTIRGSAMDRAAFLRHYEEHTLSWIDPHRAPPTLDAFRFFNSGVVLGTRDEFARLVSWAGSVMQRTGPAHQVGEHMIADQDYFQFWTNSLHAGRCQTLGWQWNHSEQWDGDFRRPGAHVLHFSNFCHGPTARTLVRMAWHRRRATR